MVLPLVMLAGYCSYSVIHEHLPGRRSPVAAAVGAVGAVGAGGAAAVSESAKRLQMKSHAAFPFRLVPSILRQQCRRS